jgi:hypothetical protein
MTGVAAAATSAAPQFYHREGEPKTPEATASIKNSRNDVNVMNDINARLASQRACHGGHLAPGNRRLLHGRRIALSRRGGDARYSKLPSISAAVFTRNG